MHHHLQESRAQGPHVFPSHHYDPTGPSLAQHCSYDPTLLQDSACPPSFWPLHDLFSAQTLRGSNCPGQEELPRLLLCSAAYWIDMLSTKRPPSSGKPGTYFHIYVQDLVDSPSASLQRTLLHMLNSKGREHHWECWWVAGLRASSLGLRRPSPSSRLPLGSLKRSLACGPVSCGGV